MTMTDHARDYVAGRKALGLSFAGEGRVLMRYAEFADARGDRFVRTGSVLGWARTAASVSEAQRRLRIVRGLVLDLRTREYVAAAETRGEPAWWIMLVEILPNARGPLIVDACLRLGYVTITIGVLGFLGLGLPPPDPDWGGMINESRGMAITFPHMTVFPCIAISTLILGFNLMADGLREISLRD